MTKQYNITGTTRIENECNIEKLLEMLLNVCKEQRYRRHKPQIPTRATREVFNLGGGRNTCYIEATLRALYQIPAFSNFLLSDHMHRKTCLDKGKNYSTII